MKHKLIKLGALALIGVGFLSFTSCGKDSEISNATKSGEKTAQTAYISTTENINTSTDSLISTTTTVIRPVVISDTTTKISEDNTTTKDITTTVVTTTEEVYDLSNITFEDDKVLYEGEYVPSIKGDLPKGCSVTYSSDSLTLPGEYQVTATIKSPSGKVLEEKTATITIEYIKDGIKYEFNQETKEITLVSNDFTASDITISDVTIDGYTYSLRNIPANIFQNDTTLKNIELPSSIKTIEAGAFKGCSNLESFKAPFLGLKKYSETDQEVESFGAVFGSETYDNSYEVKHHKNVLNLESEEVSYYIPSSLTTIEVENETAIQNECLKDFSKVTSLTINYGVTSIGSYAFQGLSITEFIIPASVTTFGKYTFQNCTLLTNVEASRQVKTIEEGMFYNCTSLQKYTLYSEQVVGDYAFYNCKLNSIPSLTLTSVGSYAFANNKSMVSASFNVTDFIGEYAFSGNKAMTTFRIDDTCPDLGIGILSGCYMVSLLDINHIGHTKYSGNETTQYTLGYLFGEEEYSSSYAVTQHVLIDGEIQEKTYYLPNGLNSIQIGKLDEDLYVPQYAFENVKFSDIIFFERPNIILSNYSLSNTDVEYLYIYGSKISVGINVLSGSSKIKNMALGTSEVKAFGDLEDDMRSIGYLFGTESFSSSTKVTCAEYINCDIITTDYYIPDSLTTFAFNSNYYNNYLLKNMPHEFSVDIYNAEKIGSNAFQNSLIKNIYIGDVNYIGSYAFSNCQYLTEVKYSGDVPSVRTINNNAFANCKNLKNLYFASYATSIGNNVFSNISSVSSLIICSEYIANLTNNNCGIFRDTLYVLDGITIGEDSLINKSYSLSETQTIDIDGDTYYVYVYNA